MGVPLCVVAVRDSQDAAEGAVGNSDPSPSETLTDSTVRTLMRLSPFPHEAGDSVVSEEPVVPSTRAKLKSAGVLTTAVLAVFVLVGIASGSSGETTDASDPATNSDPDYVPASDHDGDPLTTIAWVASMTDSDTVDIRYAKVVESVEEIETVHIIGINAPESSECHEYDSYSWTHDRLQEGEPILLVIDPTISDRDEFGRLLRRIELEDGGDYGTAALEAGVVRVETYNDPPHQLTDEYEAAEARAKQSDAGLWSPMTCDGGTVELPDVDYDGIPDSQDEEDDRVYIPSDGGDGDSYGGRDGLPFECLNEIVGNGRGDC